MSIKVKLNYNIPIGAYKYDGMTIIKKRKRERAKTIPPIEMS